MTLLCFSQTVNLRCAGLSRNESISLVIPPSISFIASFFLANKSLGHTRHKNALIFVEAFAYFGLALGDFALRLTSNATPTAPSMGVTGFSVADRAIAILTFIPLFSYTLFLLLFINIYILPFLSSTVHNLTRYLIATLIPLIITFDELGSLLGTVYGVLTTPGGTILLAQGYTSTAARVLDRIFNIVALVLLFVLQVQAAAACIPLIRRIQRITKLGGSIPGTYPRATAYLTAGILVGAVETFIGFFGESFPTILARRILMAVSRVLIIIALIHQASAQLAATPPSQGISNTSLSGKRQTFSKGMRGMIGNPRFSTFTHLDGISPFTGFDYDSGGVSPLGQSTRTRPEQRVTVFYDRINPPKLQMRFSTLELPATMEKAIAAATFRSHAPPPMAPVMSPQGSRGLAKAANASLYRYRPEYFPPSPLPPAGEAPTSRPSASPLLSPAAALGSFPTMSSLSMIDEARELEDVRTLAAQFPKTPTTGRKPSATAGRLSMGLALVHSAEDPFTDAHSSVPPLSSAGFASRFANAIGLRDSTLSAVSDQPTATSESFLDLAEPIVIGKAEPITSRTVRSISIRPISSRPGGLPSPETTVTSAGTPLDGPFRPRRGGGHKRIPTADLLASFDVFHDRFVEQRRQRSNSRTTTPEAQQEASPFDDPVRPARPHPPPPPPPLFQLPSGSSADLSLSSAVDDIGSAADVFSPNPSIRHPEDAFSTHVARPDSGALGLPSPAPSVPISPKSAALSVFPPNMPIYGRKGSYAFSEDEERNGVVLAKKDNEPVVVPHPDAGFEGEKRASGSKGSVRSGEGSPFQRVEGRRTTPRVISRGELVRSTVGQLQGSLSPSLPTGRAL